MKKHYLTFEKSLKDLDHDIDNLISIDSESDKLNQLKNRTWKFSFIEAKTPLVSQ